MLCWQGCGVAGVIVSATSATSQAVQLVRYCSAATVAPHTGGVRIRNRTCISHCWCPSSILWSQQRHCQKGNTTLSSEVYKQRHNSQYKVGRGEGMHVSRSKKSRLLSSGILQSIGLWLAGPVEVVVLKLRHVCPGSASFPEPVQHPMPKVYFSDASTLCCCTSHFP